MSGPLDAAALDQLFRTARTRNAWVEETLPESTWRELYDLVKMAPTSANIEPARFVFVTSAEGKARLAPHLSANNQKALAAPCVAVIGYDLDFTRNVPRLFPHNPDAQHWFGDIDSPQRIDAAFRNGSLQGAYLILAARGARPRLRPHVGLRRRWRHPRVLRRDAGAGQLPVRSGPRGGRALPALAAAGVRRGGAGRLDALRVLALDTALGACSVAVLDGERILAARSEPMTRGHQERLAPLAAEAMAQAGLRFSDLDRVGVTTGPGSFTGLRVGLAFARTLALALGRPCVGVGVLEALAAETAGRVWAAVPAPQDRLYAQPFTDARPTAPPAIVAADTVDLSGAALLVGPGAERLAAGRRMEIDARAWPDPAALARLVAAASEPDGPPEPLYLRPPDARTLAERGLAPRG